MSKYIQTETLNFMAKWYWNYFVLKNLFLDVEFIGFRELFDFGLRAVGSRLHNWKMYDTHTIHKKLIEHKKYSILYLWM